MLFFRWIVFFKILFMTGRYPFEALVILYRTRKLQYDKQKLQDYQFKRFNRLLYIAQKYSRYYSDVLPKKNVDIAKVIQEKRIYCNYPVLTKEILQKKGDIIDTKVYKRYIVGTTSGSTGKPLHIKIPAIALAERLANRMRFLSWWNISLYDKSVLIWGRDIGRNYSKRMKLVSFMRGRLDLNILDITNENIFQVWENLLRHAPKYIRGFKSALVEVAHRLNKAGIHAKELNLSLIIVTSEVLYDEERKFITTTFGCPVANEFGAVEGGLFAYECPEGGLHICENSVFVETDVSNNMYITDFSNCQMPLLNYKNQDRIVIANHLCSCGRVFRCIDRIEGRLSDEILKENGDVLNNSFFYYLVKGINKYKLVIEEYKVEQYRLQFTFYIVPGSEYNESYLEDIRHKMKENIGSHIVIDFEIVKELPREKSGKLRDFKRIE